MKLPNNMIPAQAINMTLMDHSLTSQKLIDGTTTFGKEITRNVWKSFVLSRKKKLSPPSKA